MSTWGHVGWGGRRRRMGRNPLEEGNVDRANDAAGLEIIQPIARAVIALTNQHTLESAGLEFEMEAVLKTKVGSAAEHTEVTEINLRDAVEEAIGHSTSTVGRRRRRKPVRKEAE
eukprot:jgi/Tetstr1/441413/TSEL_029659.t1